MRTNQLNIFITGITGLLGGELLISLSKLPEVRRIYCLIRGKSKEAIEKKLEAVFAFRNDKFDKQKIKSVLGDLSDCQLAEKMSVYSELQEINIIIHSAANTSFAKIQSRAVHEVNVNGLARIVEWSKTLKRLELFVYIGTALICGKQLSNQIVLSLYA